MKKLFIMMIGLAVAGFFPQVQILNAQNPEIEYLTRYIAEQVEQGNIIHPPLMVLDGIPFTWEEWEKEGFIVSEVDILAIQTLEKGNEGALQLFGDAARNGVLLIQTQSILDEKASLPDTEKILFLVDGSPVSQKFLSVINPNDIDSITVIKDPEKIMEYTDEDYEGVIVIVMKKLELNTN